MKTITDYSRAMTWEEEDTLLLFYFDETLRAIVADRIEFGPDETHVTLEPSLGCRVESEHGGQFSLFYMPDSKKLQVWAEASADSNIFREIFLSEVPELASFRLWGDEDEARAS